MKSTRIKRNFETSCNSWLKHDYQELCRQHYVKHAAVTCNTEAVDQKTNVDKIKENLSLFKNRSPLCSKRIIHISHQASWMEKPITTSLDVTTSHAVLSYMEDHLSNKGRLNKEWEELCKYQADNVTTEAAAKNMMKNRSTSVLPYDNNRVKLKSSGNGIENDFINASYIVDNDPRWPVYIATQGPLSSTVHQFWQMVWEQGCAV
uniref:Tyrosine-protein phosphatase domain-containing protein n=2 Tax=Ciona intestinalis TaxID=7719 RepID=F6YPN5_CIOIN